MSTPLERSEARRQRWGWSGCESGWDFFCEWVLAPSPLWLSLIVGVALAVFVSPWALIVLIPVAALVWAGVTHDGRSYPDG